MSEENERPKKPSVRWKDGKEPAKQRFILKPRRKKSQQEFPFTDEDFSVLSDLIHNLTGIVLEDHKKEMVYARLARRLRNLGVSSFRDYLHYLNRPQGTSEIAILTNKMTTNLTRFYREPHHFDHLIRRCLSSMLSDLISGRKNRIRIWSAGCSSGEEAYTIAFYLHSFLKAHDLNEIDAKILATDIDTSMLDVARQGLYSHDGLKDVPYEFARMFEPDTTGEGQLLKISSDLRKLIAFKSFNFKSNNWPMKGPFDAIFCRNVMIYFNEELKNNLTSQFESLLESGGFLYVGHAENLQTKVAGLSLVDQTTYMKKGAQD